MQELVNKIEISQVIDGRNIHDVVNTKQIGVILGISTSKAYSIMIEMESKGKACKYGYKTKDGFEDATGSRLKTNSIYWQIYS